MFKVTVVCNNRSNPGYRQTTWNDAQWVSVLIHQPTYVGGGRKGNVVKSCCYGRRKRSLAKREACQNKQQVCAHLSVTRHSKCSLTGCHGITRPIISFRPGPATDSHVPHGKGICSRHRSGSPPAGRAGGLTVEVPQD